MSYTTLYLVPSVGEIKTFREFRNAFRGAWLVWTTMSEQYLGQDAIGYMLADNMQPIWDLHANLKVPEAHRLVMMSTFDTVMVKRENLLRLAEAFDQYAKDFDDPGHIPDEANALRELAEHPDCVAVCWSSADVWSVKLEDGTDESRAYDVSLDNDHWFLFDEWESLNTKLA